MKRLFALLQRPGYRYLIIGGSVYIFEMAVIALAQAQGATPVWAVAISFSLGTAVAFFLQKLVTFGDRRMHHRILIPQIVATALLVLWNLGFSVLLTHALQNQLNTIVIRTLAIGITTLWNFYLYKTRIFKRSDTELLG
ncbi:MAG TPA: GtrA family protein [Candidatus Saccharimonadales bacterium]|nr:GtrA family protein [Candidatus Saccharimonadales bacterium]